MPRSLPLKDQEQDHDQGLLFDLGTLQRRQAIKLIAGTALVALVGCGKGGPSSAAVSNAGGTSSTAGDTVSTAKTAASSATTGAGPIATAAIPTTSATPLSSCTQVPTETAGPFPGDGSNGPNVLAQSGIIRRDIRPSVGTSTTVAKGVPLAVTLTIVDTNNSCKALVGSAVYVWHCDIDGRYSMYDKAVMNENYLRGVQEADSTGSVTFNTIWPAAYGGRWPHMHFEIYPSLAQATGSGGKLVTSQLALPEDICKVVFATEGYGQSISNLARTSLNSDMVFRDGYALQMPTVTGSVAAGYAARLVVGV